MYFMYTPSVLSTLKVYWKYTSGELCCMKSSYRVLQEPRKGRNLENGLQNYSRIRAAILEGHLEATFPILVSSKYPRFRAATILQGNKSTIL